MVRDIVATRQRIARLETAEYATMQVGAIAPAHNAAEGVLYFDTVNNDLFVNSDGANTWQLIAGGGGAVAPHNILSTSHADTTTDVPTRGSLIVGNSTPLWDELVIGGAATMLGSDGTDATWTALFDAVVPNVIQPDDAAATGAAVVAARRDHEHGIVCAAPGANLSVSTTNAEGSATFFARSDHSHAITSSSNPGAAAALLASAASGYLQLVGLGIGAAPGSADLHLATAIGITHADGVVAGQFLRANGTRYIPDTLDVADITDLAYAVPNLTLGVANAAGAANTVIRTDATILAFDAAVPDVIQCDDAAATGAAVVAARRDHTHGIVCAAPGANLSVSTTNAEGAATSFSRSDHSHAITSSSNPGAAASLLATDAGGNLSVQDLTALDDIYLADILYRSGDVDTYIDGNADQWIVAAGGVEFLRLTEAAQDILVVNEGGVDIDTRVEAVGEANALFVRGSDGNIGIGTTGPTGKLVVQLPQWTNRDTDAQHVIFTNVGDDDAGLRFGFDGTTGTGVINVIDPGVSWGDLAIQDGGGNVIIGGTNPLAKMHVDQASTTAAIPVAYFGQADLSEEMIEFNTTIGVGNPIEAVGSKLLEVTHFVRVSIPGLARYMQVGYIYTPS